MIQYYLILKDPADTRIESIRTLMMGSFNRINGWPPLVMMAAPLIAALTVLLLLRHRMNLLSLGEAEAAGIGSDLRRFRLIITAIGAVITAVVVSFCGQIGFVGFMVPMIARKIVGPSMSSLLPVSMLTGAIFLTLVFDAAYIMGLTDYLNLFTSSVGCVLLLVTLLRNGGARA
jgi:iron complex transport system permease protein